MPQTKIPFGSPMAAKRWSPQLFIDITKKSYFDRKFVSTNNDSVIQRVTDLETDSGDTISFDLSVDLRNEPTAGDNRLQGREESLRFFTDEVKIDQIRHAVSAGGRMSRQRTVHNVRSVAKDKLSNYFARLIDELTFIYLSGARGNNADYIFSIGYAGHAANPVQAPDDDHVIYGGTTKGKAALTANDKMTRAIIERASVKARTMSQKNPDTANMQPVLINGEAHYVCVMSPFQEHDLRVADEKGWLDIQRAAATAEGKANPIFKGGLGMINNVVLHSHEKVICFDDYGSGKNVAAARALFLGRQAGVIAYGSAEKKEGRKTQGLRYKWHEELIDHENEPQVSTGAMVGIKKTRFNDTDFGTLAVDTAAADPNG